VRTRPTDPVLQGWLVLTKDGSDRHDRRPGIVPGTLTKRPGLALVAIKQRGAIFAGDLEIDEVNEMLDHWCKRASRSRLPRVIRLIIDHPNSSRRDTCRRHTWGI